MICEMRREVGYRGLCLTHIVKLDLVTSPLIQRLLIEWQNPDSTVQECQHVSLVPY